MNDLPDFITHDTFVLRDLQFSPDVAALPIPGVGKGHLEILQPIVRGKPVELWSPDEGWNGAVSSDAESALERFGHKCTVVGGVLRIDDTLTWIQWRGDAACLVAKKSLLRQIVQNRLQFAWLDFWHFAHDAGYRQWEYDEAFQYWIATYEFQFDVDAEFYEPTTHFFENYVDRVGAERRPNLEISGAPRSTEEYVDVVRSLAGEHRRALPLCKLLPHPWDEWVQCFAYVFRLQRAVEHLESPDLIAWTFGNEAGEYDVAPGIRGLIGFFALASRHAMTILTTSEPGQPFFVVALPVPNAPDDGGVGPCAVIGSSDFVRIVRGSYSSRTTIDSLVNDQALRAFFRSIAATSGLP